MIQSMTGYGAAEHEGFKVEVRSLNHRYADVSVKMPSLLMEHEMPIRNLIKEKFARGKFDVIVSLTEKRQPKVRINKELAREIYQAFLELQKELSAPGPLNVDFLSWYKELLMTEESEFNAEALYSSVREAVSRVEEMRNNEGEMLEKELRRHAEKLGHLRNEVLALSKEVVLTYKENLSRKVAELASNLPIEETRLAQEVALLAQKSDITEELARLESHIRQFDSILSGGGVIGRKLDFLMQEMHREANTINSKVDEVKITNITIEMKTVIEKLREQVQNIQ